MEQTSTLLTEANRLTDSMNTYNNTLVPGFNALLAGYGLVEPVTIGQINALTLKQQGAILQALGAVVDAIGKEIATRTVEVNLLIGGGYASIDAAIADVPNHFTGADRTAIETNLTQTKNTVQVLDAQMSAAFLLDLVNRVVAIKNSVATASSQMKRV